MCLLPRWATCRLSTGRRVRSEVTPSSACRGGGAGGEVVGWLQLKPLNLGRSVANWLIRSALADRKCQEPQGSFDVQHRLLLPLTNRVGRQINKQYVWHASNPFNPSVARGGGLSNYVNGNVSSLHITDVNWWEKSFSSFCTDAQGENKTCTDSPPCVPFCISGPWQYPGWVAWGWSLTWWLWAAVAALWTSRHLYGSCCPCCLIK